jgi:GT2 family glycosyltransferase
MSPVSTGPELGVVVIGRNEGERLVRCLGSVVTTPGVPIVYVDSASTDDSVENARRVGADVVALDMSVPFTAARARNAGLFRLLERHPGVAFVQFVDGDSELHPGWLDAGRAALRADERLAAVCGKLSERYPDINVFSRLFDVEWDAPTGDVAACGGNFMGRVAALRQVGFFRIDLIAGEEPELCLRLRREGWRIRRLDARMGLHEAGTTHFRQWWRRSKRGGHAFAEAASLHGGEPERYCVAETRRILFWGGLVPFLAFGLAAPSLGASLLLLLAYPVQVARVFAATRRRGRSARDAIAYATFTVLGKLPELQGVVRFHVDRLLGRRPRLIEYKGPAAPGAQAARAAA